MATASLPQTERRRRGENAICRTMSNPEGPPQAPFERYRTRPAFVGSMTIERALPTRGRRMVGAWCFLDRFGPLAFDAGSPIDVLPHPHIGLQTVTWLARGEALHRDSLGSEALARPGVVNIMTAGRGIAHAEQTPRPNSGHLEGAQLWIALPDAVRDIAPAFEQVDVATFDNDDVTVEVFAGNLTGTATTATHYSPLYGAALHSRSAAACTLELRADFEHAVIPLDAACSLDGVRFDVGEFAYSMPGVVDVEYASAPGARALLLGGLPFGEHIAMWWNFVARTNAELTAARADWQARQRFGAVAGFGDLRIDAPPIAIGVSERAR